MASAFEWLNNIFKALGKLIPRIFLIRSTYRGVLFARDGSMKEVSPGLAWHWPIVSELRKIPVTIRTWPVGPIAIDSDDLFFGLRLIWSRRAVVQVKIEDVLLAVGLYDFHNSAVGMAETELAMKDVNFERLADRFKRYGVKLESFDVVEDYKFLPLVTTMRDVQHGGDWSEADVDITEPRK